jgi:hypothetical protein
MIVQLGDHVKVGVVVVNSALKPLKAGFEGLQVTGIPATEAEGEANADRPPPLKPPPSQEVGPAPQALRVDCLDYRGAASVPRGNDLRECRLSAESTRLGRRLLSLFRP